MLFIIDFDGTLSPQDTVDGLLARFADPLWQEVEKAWLSGDIDAIHCMKQQLRLVSAPAAELDKYFDDTVVDPAFEAFWRYANRLAGMAIVSDGLDQAIAAALRGTELADVPVYANELVRLGNGRVDIAFPHQHPQCRSGNGVCKCSIARTLAADHGGPVVLIGDGKSDACLAHEADRVIAKGHLAEMCLRTGIPHQRFDDFSDVLAIVQAWGDDITPPAASFA